MATLADLKTRYRWFMRAYKYRQAAWEAPVRLSRPLSAARVAVVTTAAFHRPDQEPFEEQAKGGDVSFRELSSDTDLAALRIAHRSDAFDGSGIEADKNLALPLDRLRELAAAGRIGGLAPRHYSFQGSIQRPEGLLQDTAPAVARRLRADDVDVALLTPV
jgi:D-proline reductase (dithiol) PrdB